jgi:tyrosine-protein kinase Etk/Wzc
MRQIVENDVGAVAPLEGGGAALERQRDLSFLDLALILLQRKAFILKVGVAVALLAFLISLVLPVRYTAEAILVPPQQNQSLQSMLLSQVSNLGNLGSLGNVASGSLGMKNQVDMYVSMLRSRTVEDAVIQRFDLRKVYKKKRMSDARKKLESNTDIEAGAKDNLIHLAVEDRDPKRSADITNAYVEEFRRLTSSLALSEASQRRAFFQEQLVSTKESLANAEEALKETEQTSGLVQVDSQAKALVQSAASIRAEIAAKQVQLQTMSSFATNENPQLQLIRRQIEALDVQLKQLGGSEQGSDVDMVALRGKISQVGLDYLRKVRDVRYYETIFELLSKQFEIAKLDEARQGTVQVVDPAVTPDKRSFPKRTLITILALFVGFIIGISWVLVSESVSRAGAEDQAKVADLRSHLWRRRSAQT